MTKQLRHPQKTISKEREPIFVQVAGSLENIARGELEELGAKVIRQIPRGFYLDCSPEVLYRLVYESRLAQRVLYPLAGFRCGSDKELYNYAFKQIDWTGIFKVSESFGIEANLSDSRLKHSLYASQVLKDAICDQFRASCGERPSFEGNNAQIIFSLYIHRDRAQISLDLGKGSLHKRGYRVKAAAAPLQETLAAAIIRASAWDGSRPLVDPMCGSGTLLAEAVMAYCRIPAGYLRSGDSMKHMPGFNLDMYEELRSKAKAKMRELPAGLVRGSDISSANLEICMSNLQQIPYGEEVLLKTSDFRDLRSVENAFIITNPPYGVRLETTDSIKALYNDLGAWLRTENKGAVAVVLCGSAELATELKLRNRWIKQIKNGDLDTVLGKFLIK